MSDVSMVVAGIDIGKARLEVKPWARPSIEYTRQMESGLIRR